MLPSQLELMHSLFKDLDKYHDGILKRQSFLLALRMNPQVVSYINQAAVSSAEGHILTLEQVLQEVEKDETYEAKEVISAENFQAANHR